MPGSKMSSTVEVPKGPYNIVVVGDGGCGKTSMLVTFAKNEYPATYVPTVFENHSMQCQTRRGLVSLNLKDTAGQELYGRLRPMFYGDGQVIVIAFDIGSRRTHQNVLDVWWPEVEHYCTKTTPKVLVGLKKDLRDTVPDCVSEQEGQELARKMGKIKYVECSAKTRDGLDVVFETAITEAMRQDPSVTWEPAGGSCCVIA
ncbi:small GTPase superfamily [Limtongia smithiae]|uniref:small GTPase superfamily n=1 Tax=Limtongia smithiae TaxID=1125753 RepID=UPI0034CFC6CA